MSKVKRSPTLLERIKKGTAFHNTKYDCYYDPATMHWLEAKCSDKECEFCKDRPPVAPKVTRNPRVSVLRWAVVSDGKFYCALHDDDSMICIFVTRQGARDVAKRGDRVVRVRVTVEVVE